MKKYIEQIKKQPTEVRKNVALVATMIIGGLIVLFWISTFSIRTDSKAIIEAKKTVVEPLTAISENAQDIYKQIKSGEITNINQ